TFAKQGTVDPSGEVIAAGSADSFEIFMWSVQTGKLLDILSGHEGPWLMGSYHGQIMFFDIQASKQTNMIEGRKDISGGRKADDRMSAANSTSGKAFNSLAYTADGRCLLAGGNSKYVVLYDVREGEGVMVKKFQISENLSLDGTQEFLDSRRVNEAGINLDLIDTRGDESGGS
ncbi:hypothetical protein MPER_03417, partial [Moniliophthora perniciosa FA553]